MRSSLRQLFVIVGVCGIAMMAMISTCKAEAIPDACDILVDAARSRALAADEAAARPKKPLLQRLDGARRAKVLAALAALIILGFALVLLAWLGARATRRYMRREPLLFEKPPDGTPVREKDWSEKPLDES